ncbi:hypothetical protein METP1_03555 [Methanosarcinales archaeon]|nr:hypothetical protein METP1_03555 [Methanosarcinales archaeon]
MKIPIIYAKKGDKQYVNHPALKSRACPVRDKVTG